jgi:hypothetical protein
MVVFCRAAWLGDLAEGCRALDISTELRPLRGDAGLTGHGVNRPSGIGPSVLWRGDGLSDTWDYAVGQCEPTPTFLDRHLPEPISSVSCCLQPPPWETTGVTLD